MCVTKDEHRAIDLGTIGRDWVRDSLDAGDSLSHVALRTLPLDEGTTYVVGVVAELPSLDKGIESLRCWSWNAVRRDNGAALLMEWIKNIVSTQNHVGIIVEDVLRPGDAAMRFYNDTVVTSDEHIIHCRDAASIASPDELGIYLTQSSTGYPLNAFVICGLSHTILVNTIEEGRYEDLVAHTQIVINAVFDNDGYSAWVREFFD
jgi:hypothetical protein